MGKKHWAMTWRDEKGSYGSYESTVLILILFALTYGVLSTSPWTLERLALSVPLARVAVRWWRSP